MAVIIRQDILENQEFKCKYEIYRQQSTETAINMRNKLTGKTRECGWWVARFTCIKLLKKQKDQYSGEIGIPMGDKRLLNIIVFSGPLRISYMLRGCGIRKYQLFTSLSMQAASPLLCWHCCVMCYWSLPPCWSQGLFQLLILAALLSCISLQPSPEATQSWFLPHPLRIPSPLVSVLFWFVFLLVFLKSSIPIHLQVIYSSILFIQRTHKTPTSHLGETVFTPNHQRD